MVVPDQLFEHAHRCCNWQTLASQEVMTEKVHVYYGQEKRWDHHALERVQQAVGQECEGFDGLQADFEFDTEGKAISAFLVIRVLGVPVEYGALGKGPSQEALQAAQNAMSQAYKNR